MPRAVSGVVHKKRVKKILKRAKGFRGKRSTSVSIAYQSIKKAMANAYIGRKLKKRDFRTLWNIRINAASRSFGLSYSKVIYALKEMNIQLNRKMLAEIAFHDLEAFKAVLIKAKLLK